MTIGVLRICILNPFQINRSSDTEINVKAITQSRKGASSWHHCSCNNNNKANRDLVNAFWQFLSPRSLRPKSENAVLWPLRPQEKLSVNNRKRTVAKPTISFLCHISHLSSSWQQTELHNLLAMFWAEMPRNACLVCILPHVSVQCGIRKPFWLSLPQQRQEWPTKGPSLPNEPLSIYSHLPTFVSLQIY